MMKVCKQIDYMIIIKYCLHCTVKCVIILFNGQFTGNVAAMI